MHPDDAWAGHSNPNSGWPRLLAYPVLVAGVYARHRRLLPSTTLFLVVDPVLFSAPESESEAWMSRAVRAERRWSDAGNPFFGLGLPQVSNHLQAPVVAYDLYAAVKRPPVRTALATVATTALKLRFVNELVRRYEGHRSGAGSTAE